MRRMTTMLRSLALTLTVLCAWGGSALAAGAVTPELAAKAERVRAQMEQRVSNEEREAAAASLKALREQIHAAQLLQADPTKRTKGGSTVGTLGISGVDFLPIPTGPFDAAGAPSVPDYNTTANWAFSPQLKKFVDHLPTLDCANPNTTQCIPIAVPDVATYPGSDYYVISLDQFSEKMHSDLPPTPVRGYVQLNNGTDKTACDMNLPGDCDPLVHNTKAPAAFHYLGPIILAERDRPVRIKFINNLGTGTDGDLFIPVDRSVMGAGNGPLNAAGENCDNTAENNTCEPYTENRATIHLHGGRTPWISDGTPHQWITPATEKTPYPKGVSVANVPDMEDPGPGAMTFYYTNQQTARLMFYHDHAFGITRLNVLAGMAAGYVITDKYEQDLVDRSIIPAEQIPLVIQDKTFVDATPVTHPVTGATVPKIRVMDPLWNWGTGPIVNATTGEREPRTGDLWLPHVYVPAQNPYNPDQSGTNPFGRWLYGPWFYPPTVIKHPPVDNPYYDPDCGSTNPYVFADCQTPGQPPKIPATPHPSMGMEAFLDTMVVNGTVYPKLEVEPRAYRFRILNAAGDRGLNLSIYKADPTQVSSDGRANTEVKMVDSAPNPAWPALWPADGREGGVPDPGTLLPDGRYSNWGPSWIQIGTDAGFLPRPVVKDPQPITYVTDPTAFWVGVVKDTSLGLMPAERADVIVDFSGYEGQTLIVYNDAPTAWPALDVRYDYFTGAPDRRANGGFGDGGTFNAVTGEWEGGHGTAIGFGPNTRTVMQIVVKSGGAATYNKDNLDAEFTTAAPLNNLGTSGIPLFERAMEPIIVGQAAYNEAYSTIDFPTVWPWSGIRSSLLERTLKFVTVDNKQVEIPLQPKGIHDEMGASFDPDYGRMSGNLAIELEPPTTNNANLSLYGFSDVPTETIANSTTPTIQVDSLGQLADGTQIWNISHNGVDTHPIHFHIFDVQLVSRLGWDGQIALPEPNELGWKDTVRISPLMDTVVAVRPVAPLLPFGIANSVRPLNPAIPINSTMGFSNVDPKTGQAYVAPSPWVPGGVKNILFDFGWEYVWHCHILSHEEMDMMRPIILQVETLTTDVFTLLNQDANATAGVDLEWEDASPVDYTNLPDYLNNSPGDFGNMANEIGFNVWRSTDGTGEYAKVGSVLANQTLFTDLTGNTALPLADKYVIEAYNASGSTYSEPLSTVTLTVTPPSPAAAPANINLTVIVGDPLAQSVTKVQYFNGTTLIGESALLPDYSFDWNGIGAGTYEITALAIAEVPNPVAPLDPAQNILLYAVSDPTPYTVSTGLTVSFAATGTALCETLTLTPTVVGGTAPYAQKWVVNGVTYNNIYPAIPVIPALAAGTYPVTLTVTDTNGDKATYAADVVITSTPPTATIVGGPFTVNYGGTVALTGTGTLGNICKTPLTYAWDIDSNGTYDYFTQNRTIKHSVVYPWIGEGVKTITYKVTDTSGAFATATAELTVGPLPVAAPASISVPLTSITGNYTVSWAASTTPGATYVLEESTTPGFLDGTVSEVLDRTTPVSATITGKTEGTYYYRVKAVSLPLQDSLWRTAANGCVVPAISITTTSPRPDGTVGLYFNNSFVAASGIPPYTWSVVAGSLPPGLTLNASTGWNQGTPTTPGSYAFDIRVQDSLGAAAVKSFTQNVVAATLQIANANVRPAATVGTYFNNSFVTSGGVAPFTWAVVAGSLPPGLTLNTSQGWNQGTPTTVGNYVFDIRVTDSLGSIAVKSFTQAVNASQLAISTTSPLAAANTEVPFSTTFARTGGTGPYSWSVVAGSLPPGLILTPSTGVLAGTPTTAGSYNFDIQVLDNLGATAVRSFAQTVNASPLTITSASPLAPATLDVAYSTTLVKIGGTGPYSWSVLSGTLPPGITLTPATGAYAGTPTTVGNYSFTLQVSDNLGATASKSFTHAVNLPSNIAITSTSPRPNATVGTYFNVSFTAANGTAPYTWTVDAGTMPPGLILNASQGWNQGTPTVPGVYNFDIRVTDSLGATTVKSFTQTVLATPLSITTTSPRPDATVGTYFNNSFVAKGGVAPYTWSVSAGALPPGLTLNATQGWNTGYPTTPGVYNFDIQVRDSLGATFVKSFTQTVN